MAMKWDDLSVKQWVAIEHEREDDDEPSSPFMRRARESRVDGTPLQILEISMPFVCVTNGKHRFVLDLRKVDLCRITAQYVKTLTSTPREYDGGAFLIKHVQEKKKTEENADSGRACCPYCGSRLIQRFVDNIWVHVCRECGFSGSRGAAQ
jgi:hypothetical protein